MTFRADGVQVRLLYVHTLPDSTADLDLVCIPRVKNEFFSYTFLRPTSRNPQDRLKKKNLLLVSLGQSKFLLSTVVNNGYYFKFESTFLVLRLSVVVLKWWKG